MSRVLLYRALGLGDFLTAVPAYRAVRRAFPAYDVVLAAPRPLQPLAVLSQAVDTFLPTAELAVPAWCGAAPEVAVNLHGSGPQSHQVLTALRPERLVAYASTGLGIAGPAWRADEHEVARWCRLLDESGIPAHPGDLDLAVPEQPSPRAAATVLHPGAADPARRWPAQRFAALARALRADGHDVVVTGVESERELAETVARAGGLDEDAVLAGGLDLEALAALVADARLVVCGDTGVAHLATAYRTPSVLLFGAMPPALWGPPAGRAEHTVLWHSELMTGRSATGPHPALRAITVDEALAATRRAGQLRQQPAP
ncbi:MAG: hypothetical protein QOE19_2545 [Actinomycetota bacterium]|nr:hypothetical protein [Actinomycetota bacterium]